MRKNINLYLQSITIPPNLYIIQNFFVYLLISQMQSNTAFNTLLDMGCSPALCEASIRQLKTQDLSALLDWISEHSEEQEKWTHWLKQNPQSNQAHSLNQPAECNQSIQPLINKAMRDQLVAKGHSKNVSQKALLLTGNASAQSAQKWIQQHKFDPDFQQQLKLQGQAYNQSKLSPQQAKAKLDELTKKARQVRKLRQQQQTKEREKNRVRYAKQMQEAKRIAQEQGMKRQVELDRIQKQKDQDYKRKLLEEMRRQRNAKLGIKEQINTQGPVKAKKQEKKMSLIEQVQLQCEQVKVGNHAYPDVAKTFFQTAQIYINNVIKNNGQQKFRKINKENKAFQNRICEAFGGVQFLTVLGYEQEGNALILRNYNLDELKKVSDILERYKSWY